ncbi:MAG TPA: RNA polymerase sigma factor RpoD, partial [Enorma massiliensis]
MPKKSENSTELNSYIDKLVDMGAKSGSVTEDEIQVVLKDVEVSDAQLTSIYRSLRDHGVEV